MTAMDTLNQRFGKGTVLTASAGLDGVRREWSMKQLGPPVRFVQTRPLSLDFYFLA